ncbi:MAG: DNA ligase 1 [Amphiamblys sp. WSBS2006]|nr:MAG: DNA ligase 1 [Amphiamblys sp. WSBS2006]
MPAAQNTLMFSSMCDVLDEIEKTTKRLSIIDMLSAFFRQTLEETPQQLVQVIHLLLNEVGPVHENLPLGIGEAMLVSAVSQTSGRRPQAIRAELRKAGDLGTVAQREKNSQSTMVRPKRLSVNSVFQKLREVSTVKGANATKKKTDILRFLLVSCVGSETKFLVRLLQGKLRVGLAEKSLLAALANALADLQKTDREEAVGVVRDVFCIAPLYEEILEKALEHGVRNLRAFITLRPGVPLKPMLAFPAKSVSEVLQRTKTEPFCCEYKYDGERAQIHITGGDVAIYSRNMENTTERYFDLKEKIRKCFRGQEAVIDAEVVAWSREKNKALPFQVLSTRKRKAVAGSEIKVDVCVFVFDILYLDGVSLVAQPLRKRREKLRASIIQENPHLQLVSAVDCSGDEKTVEAFMEEALENGSEGLMVKLLDAGSTYEPSQRSRSWLKLKKDYIDGAADSLDLVVIGAYYGKGKRTGVFGGYLLACYSPDEEEYQPICKLGTGFSEADLEEHTRRLSELLTETQPAYYRTTDTVRPDVWLVPKEVWEVKAADYTLSPVYTAAYGLVDSERGVSLRFPRFLRKREDKGPEDASDAGLIADLYTQQASHTK